MSIPESPLSRLDSNLFLMQQVCMNSFAAEEFHLSTTTSDRSKIVSCAIDNLRQLTEDVTQLKESTSSRVRAQVFLSLSKLDQITQTIEELSTHLTAKGLSDQQRAKIPELRSVAEKCHTVVADAHLYLKTVKMTPPDEGTTAWAMRMATSALRGTLRWGTKGAAAAGLLIQDVPTATQKECERHTARIEDGAIISPQEIANGTLHRLESVLKRRPKGERIPLKLALQGALEGPLKKTFTRETIETVLEETLAGLSEEALGGIERPTVENALRGALTGGVDRIETAMTIRTTFADNLSLFIITFLKEQLLHIEERDNALKSPFLKWFFEDPYDENLSRTKVGDIVIPLLEKHEALAQNIVRANILKAMASGYNRIEQLQKNNPYLLVKYVQDGLDMATKEITKEEATRTEGGAILSREEREYILKRTFQKNATKFLFSLIFPEGAADLFIPFVPTRDLGIVRPRIWNVLNEEVEYLLSSFLEGITEFQDIKNSLLITGLQKAEEVLSGPPPQTEHAEEAAQPTGGKRGHRGGGLVAVGMIVAFIKVIFDAILHAFSYGRTETSDYSDQKKFDSLLHRIYKGISKESFIARFIPKFMSKRVVRHIGPSLVDSIKGIRLTDLIDEQLSAISQKIGPESQGRLFPRTLEEKQEADEIKQGEREADQNELAELEGRIGKNIGGVVSAIEDAYQIDKTGIDTNAEGARKALNLIKIRMIDFANACISSFVRFILWACRAKGFVRKLSRQAYKKTDLARQDVLVTKTAKSILEDLSWQIETARHLEGEAQS